MDSHFSALCKKSRYRVGIQTFDKLSFVSIKDPTPNSTLDKNITSKTSKDSSENGKDNQKENTPSRAIYIYYSTTNVRLSSTSKLVSLSSFISSIGGNLGLFIGFSFMSVLLYVYKCLLKMTPSKKKDKIVLDNIENGDFISNKTVYYL